MMIILLEDSMKNILVVAVLLSSLGSVQAAPGASASGPQTEQQKTLYTVGLMLGQNVQPWNLTSSDVRYVEMGLKDAALGHKPQVDVSVYGHKVAEFAKTRAQESAQKEEGAST